jgi:lipopolysaccharide transport system ATP-binding protein
MAIQAEALSKTYPLGRQEERYRTLRDTLAAAATAPFRQLRSAMRGQSRAPANDTIVALREVSFDIRHGAVVGIVGRNGAGKSTLLKILSRITEPSSGHAEIQGRIGSLLEVGTGFHPELSGRENVYLNGAILGMRRREIERKFDEIVAFAEVEKFMDTPVKHYSTGMHLRLAFAVAAHLEPDILLVDEVLAVGDIDFQKKCLGKMGQVARGGRTVLFVSHNMAAIAALCTTAMLLTEGRLAVVGSPDEVIGRYLAQLRANLGIPLASRSDRLGDGRLRFIDFAILNRAAERVGVVQSGQEVTFEIGVELEPGTRLKTTAFQISFVDQLGQKLFMLLTHPTGTNLVDLKSGDRVRCHVPFLPLLPGTYVLHLISKDALGYLDAVYEAVELHVIPGDLFGTGKSPKADGGSIAVPHRWYKVGA